MTESLFYIQRIRAQYDTGIFSKSDKRIADYLLEHPGAVDGETASSIAEKVGTSPATVVRFCRKLGFKGLTDMKNSAAYSNYIESSTTDMDLKKTDTVNSAIWVGKLCTGVIYAVMMLHVIMPYLPQAVSIGCTVVCAGLIVLSLIVYTARYIKLLGGTK